MCHGQAAQALWSLPDSGAWRWCVPAEPTWSLVLIGECLLMMAAPLVMGSPTAARPSGCSRRLRPGGRNCRTEQGQAQCRGTTWLQCSWTAE